MPIPVKDKIVLSPDQDKAVEAILAFWQKRRGVLTFGGYAGTGKSTCLAEAMRLWKKRGKDTTFAFASLTGKAAEVLRGKLNAAGICPDRCGTIHSLIYSPIEDKETGEVKWLKAEEIPYDYIVIDEASMVNSEIYRDLLSFKKPILFCGDHGQLPPVNDSFNLMEKPDIRLDKIHRQVENSPIIKVATMAREDGYIPVGVYGDYVRKITDWGILERIDRPDDCMVIVNFNNTRVLFNEAVRRHLGILDPNPIKGDKVICLKNRAEAGIFNGMVGLIQSIEEFTDKTWDVEVEFDSGHSYSGIIAKSQFNHPTTLKIIPENTKDDPVDLYDFGFCLTAWKAQGSEHKRVIVFEQRSSYMDDDMWRRFLYTSVTRSSERLIVVGS